MLGRRSLLVVFTCFETGSCFCLCLDWPRTHSPSASASGVAEITGMEHHKHIFFLSVFLSQSLTILPRLALNS
jgi:hypothetical protein